ncbi:putative sinapine esterase [Helianthus annuus]|nr:putative sinapine esterase [Helianthus annuus]
MASSSSVSFGVILVCLLMSCFMYANGCYTSIISFGDSLADTGNLKQLGSISNREVFPLLLPPYGENFLNQSTGRCSNGRLIIDFLGNFLYLSLSCILYLMSFSLVSCQKHKPLVDRIAFALIIGIHSCDLYYDLDLAVGVVIIMCLSLVRLRMYYSQFFFEP